MPSHKKLRPRRPLVSPDTENVALDAAPRCCHPDHHPPLHGANAHNRRHAFSSEEKISNLMQLNDSLVKQVSSMRRGESETSAKIKSLDELLQSSRSNTDALLMQGKSLELELATLKKDLAGLQIQNTALLAEKDELEDALSDLSVRQQELKEQLDAERKASAASRSELCALTHDVEVLRMDNEKLADQNKRLTDENEDVIDECTGLKSENAEIRSELKLLRSKETTLEEKLADMSKLYDEERLKAINANKMIDVLQAEASRGSEAIVKLEGQLIEASQRITFLETKHAAAHESQCLLSAQVKGLENHLATERDAHEKAASALQQERRAKDVGMLAVAYEVDKLRLDKSKLIDESSVLKSLIASMEIDAKQRQEKEVRLEEELLNERNAHAAAQLVITSANESIKALQDAATSRDEAISNLAAAQLDIASASESIKVLQAMNVRLEEKILNERKAHAAAQLEITEALRDAATSRDEAISNLAAAQLEITSANESIKVLQATKVRLEDQILNERDAYAAARLEIASANESIKALRDVATSRDEALSKLAAAQLEIVSANESIKVVHATKVTLEEELLNERNALAAAQLEIMSANESIKELRDATTSRAEAIAKVERNLREASQQIVVLEAQRAAATDRQCALELQVARLESELVNSSSALEQEREAKEDEICSLNCKVEHLRLDKEKLIEQNSALSAKITGFQSAMKQLQSKEATLGKDLTKLRSSHSSAQTKINDLTRTIETLESEASRRNADVTKLESRITALQNDLLEQQLQAKESLDSKEKELAKLGDQMKESSQQMEQLDSQIAASMVRQIELETQIKALQKDLLASSNCHLSASSALEKEKQARCSLEGLLDASQARCRSLVEHLESVKSCLLGKDYTSNAEMESFQSLQSQLFCLVDEKKALEETKAALEKKVNLLNAKATQTSLKAKLESDKLAEQLRQLELALSDVKDEVLNRDNKVSRLETDLRRAKIFLEEKTKQVKLTLPMAVASTGALMFVGLLSYLRGMEN